MQRRLLDGRTFELRTEHAGQLVPAGQGRCHLAGRAGGGISERRIEQRHVLIGGGARLLDSRHVLAASPSPSAEPMSRSSPWRHAEPVAERCRSRGRALAALEVEIDPRRRRAAHSGAGREQRILRRELLAHDDDLFPLARRRLGTGGGQLARGLQELLLVAPDEEDFEELQLQIPPLGLAPDGDADEVGGLIVQAVGHVEIGLGQRVALIQVDRGLAADRVRGSGDMLGGDGRCGGGDFRPLVRTAFLDDECIVVMRPRCRTDGGGVSR